MAEWFFFIIITTMLNLTLVKFIFFKDSGQGGASKQDNVSWHAAVDQMSTMESRIDQLTKRDLKQQEKVWKLEDLNRELQEKTMRLTKELLASQNHDDPYGNFGEEDEEDDDSWR